MAPLTAPKGLSETLAAGADIKRLTSSQPANEKDIAEIPILLANRVRIFLALSHARAVSPRIPKYDKAERSSMMNHDTLQIP